MKRTREISGSWRKHASRAAAALLALIVVGLGVLVFVNRSTPKRRGEAAAGSSCNGVAALCERRLDEVVFPGTHNAMVARLPREALDSVCSASRSAQRRWWRPRGQGTVVGAFAWVPSRKVRVAVKGKPSWGQLLGSMIPLGW
jgi:hypothetical protein